MMVSSLTPPSRKHKKKNRHKQQKNGPSSSSSKGKKRKEKSAPPKSEVSALYTEDIGMVGVKRTKVASAGPVLKGPEGVKFQISESSEEKLRRHRRKARFDKEGGPTKQKRTPKAKASSLSSFTKKSPKEEPDFLSRPLSSGRKDLEGRRSSRGKGNSQRKSHAHVVGTNQELEKPYLRLTTYVKAEKVRPLEVLINSLAHIKSKYYQEEDFDWANEQLKSVRQDITVQRLRNRFVLDVYETHARILLEHGDLAEFNQCQTMIRYLTTTGVEPEDASLDVGTLNPGDDEDDMAEALEQSEESSDEFRAYFVIYAIVQNSWEDLTKALVRARTIVRDKEDQSSCKTASSRHSMEVVKSVTHNDYRAFFKLYGSAPHMSAYLMDFLVKRMREKAYERITAAYRPTICVEYFRGTLCFHDMEETRLFLRQMGAVFVKGEPPLWVDCKESSTK